ncbi:hypothetical protein SK128_000206 [Halocaridina rubra]|uniref:Coiled-coil domain-containing protein 39 n=1 Tax=Halocaridina rubra TaxID=373956 RepID=A0AAN9AF22_HALRR
MEAALDKALANPGMGLLLLDGENRGLAEDVERLRQEVAAIQETYNREEISHKKNSHNVTDMSQRLDNLQHLVLAHQKDIDIESQNEKASVSEKEAHLRHCRLKQNEHSNTLEISEHLQLCLTQSQREYEDLQKNIFGDSSLLKELLDHLSDADNDNLLLLQYSAEDASKIKNLSVELERTSGEIAAAEAELSMRQSEAGAARTVLEQLGNAFLQAAAQRDHLLSQWEETLNHIYQVSNTHTQIIEDSIATRQKLEMVMKDVQQENEIHKQVKNSHGEILSSLHKVEDEEVWLNTQIKLTQDTKEQIQSQLWMLQNAYTRLKKDIENQQKQLLEKRSYCGEKEAQVASMEQQCIKADQKLTLNSELVCSVEESVLSLQAMLKEGESLLRGLLMQKERVMDAEQHHLRAVNAQKEQEATAKSELNALLAAKTRNMNYIKELHGRGLKQKEVLHDLEGHLQQLRKRLHDLTHDANNNVEDADQQKQLEFLQLRLQETSSTIRLLTKQLTLLKNARTREQTNVTMLEKDAKKLEGEATAIKMSCDCAQRESSKMREKREELMVDVSLTQLHLQRRMSLLQAVKSNAFRLSTDKSDMEKMVNEQITGVKMRISETEYITRGLDAEMHRLSLQMHEVNTRVAQLQDKYKKLKASIDNLEGEDEVSTTQLFLKVASERAGLQETGDMLDLEIRRAEEEVEALQQMVGLLSIEGQQYRSQLHQILYYSEEEKDRVLLEENLSALEEDIADWRVKFDQIQKELQSEQNKLHEVELQVHAVEELLREKNIHMTAVSRETENQITKTFHAGQAVTNLQHRTRTRLLQQNDVELRLAQERLRVVNSLLGDAANSHPEASEAVVIYCQQVNVPPPDIVKLTKKPSFDSRSSIGTLESSQSNDSSRPRSMSSGEGSLKNRSRHSSVGSIHSEDSGRSGSPPRPGKRSQGTSDGSMPLPSHKNKHGIIVMTPAFPTTEVKRSHFHGKKLPKRPTHHI